MSALRRLLACTMLLVALLLPAPANAGWLSDRWNDVKSAVGSILDWSQGGLEIAWEGAYGAGCGVKNLVTWDGTACSSSVKRSGDTFRSLIRDVDDCALTWEPTGVTQLMAAHTVNDDDTGLGLTPDEIDAVLDVATTEGDVAKFGLAKYLESPGGRAAVSKNPVWAKVARRLPIANKVAIALNIAHYCGSTLDFLFFGTRYLAQGEQVWQQRDGVWMHCTITCKPDPALNYPGCEAMFVAAAGQPVTGRQELVCRPGTGPPGPTRAPTDQLRKEVCGSVISPSGSKFHYGAYCDEQMRKATTACRNGTSARPDLCARLTGGGGTTVTTEGGGGAGGTRSSAALDARNVPGGSVAGSCASLIRSVAASGSASPHGSEQLRSCLGTSDASCFVLRARAGAGHAVFPLAPDVQRRCFG